MIIKSNILIIGAGYSGLITQKKLKENGIKSIIVERGYNHGYGDSDYVTICKKEYPFTSKKIQITTRNISSGCENFKKEFTKKVYNKTIEANLFFQDTEVMEGYCIDNEYLLDGAFVYGNIEITKINLSSKVCYGKILHLGKDVEFHYEVLISTIPIYEFQKLIGANFLEEHDVFISYFPIGVKKRMSASNNENMTIEYYSDSNIPFYRKQYYGNSVFYEYCLNRPYKDFFDIIVRPGKFIKSNNIDRIYETMMSKDVYFIGRFATWNPDFLLDDIWNPCESISNRYIRSMYNHIGVNYED